MLHYFLILLAMQPSVLLPLYGVHRVVPMKRPWVYILLTLLTMDLLWAINILWLPRPVAALDFLNLAVGFFYLLFAQPRGQKLLSLFTYAVMIAVPLVVVNLMANVITLLPQSMEITLAQMVDLNHPLYPVMSLLVGLFSILPVLVAAWGLKRIFSTLQDSKGLLWFLSIPVSQTFLLLMLNFRLDQARAYGPWAGIIFGVILCVAADIACLLGYRRYYQLSQQARQVRQAEQQLNIQSEYYREMQSNILAVNQIRHDLKNQLKTAYYLLEQGHPEEVRQQLEELQGYIQQKVGTHYCDNLMVDAVLTEKASVCRQLGIDLQITALVPMDLPIESAHLCSTFSNMLDNSIEATKKAGIQSGPIVLRSDIHGSYLTVFCSNPGPAPTKVDQRDVLRQHGLGLQILNRLARFYDGNLQTDFRDGRFQLTMMLKIKE